MNRYPVPPYMRRHMMSRRHQPKAYALLLFLQLVERISQLNSKPPITLLLIFLNLFIFYATPLSKTSSSSSSSSIPPFLIHFLRYFHVRDACVLPRLMKLSSPSHNFKRLILATFTHLSDIHVLYNCSSLLYKGVSLEPILGSIHFLGLVFYLALTSHILYVFIAHTFPSFKLVNNCVAGFSGVLFGFKAILNTHPRFRALNTHRVSYIFGIRIPSGPVAPWVELIITSAIMPNVSILGHFCGIIAGLSYVFIPKFIASSIISPLLYVFSFLNLRLCNNNTNINSTQQRQQQHYRPFQGRGRRLHAD